MKGLWCVACALCVLGLVAVGAAEDKKDKAKDDKKGGIEGRYTVVSGEESGKAVPAEKLKGSVVVVTKDKMLGTDKEKKEFFAAEYTLDTSKTPWALKMTSIAPKKGEMAMGVAALEGDTLKICYNLPGGAPPTGFKTGDKQNCFVLKREAGKDDKKDK